MTDRYGNTIPFFHAIVFTLFVICFAGMAGCVTWSASTPSSSLHVQDGVLANDSGITVTDSLGVSHTLPHTVQRIICQNGDAAELLIVLGAGDRVVGVVRTTEEDAMLMQHMPNARSVGDWQTPNIERILALEPDVILTYSSPTKNADQLAAANLTLIPVDSYKIPDLNREAQVLGTLTGTSANVSRYTKFNDRYLVLVKERVAGRNQSIPLRVYVEGYSDYSIHATGSGGDLLLNLLNASNIGSSIDTPSAKVTPEWVIDQDPDVIIKIAMDPAKYESLDTVREKIVSREGFSEVKAVRTGRVYVLNGDVISSPRGIVGLLYTTKALYPEEFSDTDPNLVLDEYAREFVSGTDSIQTFSPVL